MGLIFILFRLLWSPLEMTAFGSENQARLLPLSPEDSKITGLAWDNSEDIEIQAQANGGGTYRYYAIVKGRYTRADWSLLLGKGKMVLLPEGRFSLQIPIEEVETSLSVMAFSSNKMIEEEHRTVFFPEWAGLHQKQVDLKLRRLFFSSNAELTSIAYKQTAISDLSEWALRVQGSEYFLHGATVEFEFIGQ